LLRRGSHELVRRTCNRSAAGFGGVMFPYVALAKDKAWQPGSYEGVELMILHKHETTAGLVVLRKFQAGHTIPAHTHPEANEWAYVLAGEWEACGTIYTVRALLFARKGTRHGRHVRRAGWIRV